MALLLRDVVGLSYAEIADALETTLATVKWRIYKAREVVATELARGRYGRPSRAAPPGASAVASRVPSRAAGRPPIACCAPRCRTRPAARSRLASKSSRR